MRRDLLVTTPPAELEAGVNSIVRSIVVKRMGSEGSPKITLHSWRVRYWSFLRRVSVSNGKLKSFTVWLKIPKRDPSCRDLAQVLEDPKQRQAAHDEAKAYLDLAQVFGKADSPDPVSFVTVLDWCPEWSVIVTLHEDLPALTPVLRRAKRRINGLEWNHARGAIHRAGGFLRRAHEGVPADASQRETSRDRCIAHFDAMLVTLGEDYPRWDLPESILRKSSAIRDAIRAGYSPKIPFVATHRGVDARNLLDDGTRQVWLDPEMRIDDVAYHDLARMIATLGMIDYGGVGGFVTPILPRPWIESLNEGYGHPSWIDSRTLSAFHLYWLLDRFEDSRRMLQVQPWGPAVRILDALYTRRFYGALLADALQEGNFS